MGLNELRVSLDEEEFIKLVSGEILTVESSILGIQVKICLKDIGYERMQSIIEEIQGEELPG